MARASIKENKSPYQTTRESLKLTREAASELLEAMSPERIEKIENDRTMPHPDEVLLIFLRHEQHFVRMREYPVIFNLLNALRRKSFQQFAGSFSGQF